MIKQKVFKIKKILTQSAVALLSIGALVLNQGVAQAAGTLVVSVEPASGSYVAGSVNAYSLYGTNSGINTSGFSFTATLQNMTIDHFDASGNPFSLDSISSGGAAGSTSVTITVGYSGASGGTGKQLVGKLYTKAGSTGTAKITISAVDAYDSNLASMTGSGTTGTYSVTAASCPSGQTGTPPNCTTPPAATCPSGQTGTPPNCKAQTTTNKCATGQTGTYPNCVTPTTNKCAAGQTGTYPNCVTPSTVTVPTPGSNNSVGSTNPQTVTTAKEDEVLATQSADAPKTSLKTTAAKKSSKGGLYIGVGIGLLVLVGGGTGVLLFLKKRSLSSVPVSQFAASSVASTPDMSTNLSAVPNPALNPTPEQPAVQPLPQNQQEAGTIIRPTSNNNGGPTV